MCTRQTIGLNPYSSRNFSNSVPITFSNARAKPYSGWASYKNVKSGNYDRTVCNLCNDFKGFPQTPGVYDTNVVTTPPGLPNPKFLRAVDNYYQVYQAERMQNNPGQMGGQYSNYFNTQCGNLYPKRYVKGNWPDEQLEFTRTPAGGCNTVPQGVNVCAKSV